MSTLNMILSDEDTSEEDVSAEEVTVQPVENPDATPPEEEPQAEEPSQEEPGEDVEPPAEDARMVPLSALQEERQKRQELSERLDRLEVRNEPAPPEPEPMPDPVEDPDAHRAWINNNLRIAQLNAFEESARDVHGDDVVDRAFKAFQAIDGTPEAAAIQASRNPWRSLVQWHKGREDAALVSSDEWRQAEREKIRAELLAEQNVGKPAVPPPPSLAKAANLGDRTQREPADEHLSLDEILGNPTA